MGDVQGGGRGDVPASAEQGGGAGSPATPAAVMRTGERLSRSECNIISYGLQEYVT
jgi:hypothetical protein